MVIFPSEKHMHLFLANSLQVALCLSPQAPHFIIYSWALLSVYHHSLKSQSDALQMHRSPQVWKHNQCFKKPAALASSQERKAYPENL